MIIFLRCLFIVVLGSMIAVTGWASRDCAVWAIPHDVVTHPWFIATLADCYWAFLTFFIWVAYKERSWLSRALWLIAILLLGNMAMAAYCLIQLFRVRADARFTDVVLRPEFAAARSTSLDHRI